MSPDVVKGSCHCGAVSYSARFDTSAPTIRCNCSLCTKSRAWIAPIPASDFELLSDDQIMTQYRFGECTIAHCFCSCCGVKTHGRIQGSSGEDVLIAVCVSTLDLTPSQFAEIPISYIDGRNDRLDHTPEVITYL